MTVLVRQPMEENGCGGARGKTDATLTAVGDVIVACFQLPDGIVSIRVDIEARGAPTSSVRVRALSGLQWPPRDSAVPGPGIVVVDGAVTLAGPSGAWAIGAGPSWGGRYLYVALSLLVVPAGGVALVSTVEVNADRSPCSPFRTLGVEVTA